MAQAVRDVFIAPVQQGKGRTFRASALALLEANKLWDGGEGGGDVIRPAWAVFAGSDQEMRPFVANLLAGRKALFGSGEGYRSRRESKMELLKSARYEVAWQREPEGSLATVFLPDLFRIDPGMVDPDGAAFVVLARGEWLAEQSIEGVDAIVRHASKLGYPVDKENPALLAAMAYLFVVYLDRRTRCPIYADGRFYLQLLLAFLQEGSASFARPRGEYGEARFGEQNASAHGFAVDDMSPIGVARPLAFRASHDAIERVLAEQTTIFFDRAKV